MGRGTVCQLTFIAEVTECSFCTPEVRQEWRRRRPKSEKQTLLLLQKCRITSLFFLAICIIISLCNVSHSFCDNCVWMLYVPRQFNDFFEVNTCWLHIQFTFLSLACRSVNILMVCQCVNAPSQVLNLLRGEYETEAWLNTQNSVTVYLNMLFRIF